MIDYALTFGLGVLTGFGFTAYYAKKKFERTAVGNLDDAMGSMLENIEELQKEVDDK